MPMSCLTISLAKPFMPESTMISAATPSVTPSVVSMFVKLTKICERFGRR